METQIFEVFAQHPGSNISPSNFPFIRLRGRYVPEWIPRCAKPFAGTIPAGASVFDVDTEAEQRERADAVQRFQERPDLQLEEPNTIAYLRRVTRCSWTQADFDHRPSDFPQAHGTLKGAWGLPDFSRVFWLTHEIDQWIAKKRAEVETITRLVGVANGR